MLNQYFKIFSYFLLSVTALSTASSGLATSSSLGVDEENNNSATCRVIQSSAVQSQEDDILSISIREQGIASCSYSSVAESASRKRPVSMFMREESPETPHRPYRSGEHVYAVPTTDAAFKYVMNDQRAARSFLRAFIPDENIVDITPLDVHLSPLQKYTQARHLIHSILSVRVMEKIDTLVNEEGASEKNFSVGYRACDEDGYQEIFGAALFLKELAEVYEDIRKGYPLPDRNSQVDFLCQIDGGHYVIVEVQVSGQKFWDKRALAYASSIYTRQLKKGDGWYDLKKVICINLLGGGPHQEAWRKPVQFRRWSVRDQDGHEMQDGIEILQYPLYHEATRSEVINRETLEAKTAYLEWLDFWEYAAQKKESDMDAIKTPDLKHVYSMIKLQAIPEDILHEYHKEINSGLSEPLAVREARKEGREEGREEGRKDVARKMLISGISDEMIMNYVGLSQEELEALRQSSISSAD